MSRDDTSVRTDLLVIGAGPGGYVAAIRAGQLGMDVILIDKDAFGGTCLNYGCVPSKAMISSTDIIQTAQRAEERGVHADLTIDYERMVDWKDEVVSGLTNGVERLCQANGVRLMEGHARFADAHTAIVSGESDDGEATRIGFDHAVIATGSRPREIPGFSFEDDPILSSRDVLELRDIPESLLIVGAGYIGMELAGVFARIGSDVTVIEALDEILPGYDTSLTEPVEKRARELGIQFRMERVAKEWQVKNLSQTARQRDDAEIIEGEPTPQNDTDAIEVVAEADRGDTEVFQAERVLVAVGRVPVTDSLNLGMIDLEPRGDGFLEVDEQGRTSHDHIFAIGDVSGEPMLAHKASHQGEVVAEVIAGEPRSFDYVAVPSVVYTHPEIASVGMNADDAEQAGFSPVVGRFPFQASGRALTTGHPEGLVRLVADEKTGFILGGQIVGPEASELIAEVGFALEMGARLEDISATIHAHPTLSEAVMEAAKHARGHAIHTINS